MQIATRVPHQERFSLVVTCDPCQLTSRPELNKTSLTFNIHPATAPPCRLSPMNGTIAAIAIEQVKRASDADVSATERDATVVDARNMNGGS
jgi:hypothetical protein